MTRLVLGEAISVTVALLREPEGLTLCSSVRQESAAPHRRGSCFAHQPHILMCRGDAASGAAGKRRERRVSEASAGTTVVRTESWLLL